MSKRRDDDNEIPSKVEIERTSVPAPRSKSRRQERRTNNFFEQYRHPKWQEMRLRILERAGFRCEECGNKEETLQVHHGYYEKNLKPWEYPEDSLHCLCETCHEHAEILRIEAKRAVGLLGFVELEKLIGYAKGLFSQHLENVGYEGEASPPLNSLGSYEAAEGFFLALDCATVGRRMDLFLTAWSSIGLEKAVPTESLNMLAAEATQLEITRIAARQTAVHVSNTRES